MDLGVGLDVVTKRKNPALPGIEPLSRQIHSLLTTMTEMMIIITTGND
jgi:hypothetical protein